MASDVAFPTPQQVNQKLAEFEEQFQHRYTEKDDGYRKAVSRNSWWYRVPVMHPWPPRRSQRNYHHHYDERDRGQRRGYRGWNHPPPSHRSPPPPTHRSQHYYDDREQHSNWTRHRSRSPSSGYIHREHYQRSPRGHRSPSPHIPPPSRPHPSHPHSLSPPHRDRGGRSPTKGHSPHISQWQPDESPWQSEGHSDFAHLLPPMTDDTGVKERGVEGRESELRDEEKKDQDKDSERDAPKDKPPALLLGELAMEDGEPKAPPSASDVMDILNIAHVGRNAVTSGNLKKVQKKATKERKRMQGKKPDGGAGPGSKPISLKVLSLHQPSSLLISHGTTTNVASSGNVQGHEEEEKGGGNGPVVLKPRRRKRPVVIEEEESDDDGAASSAAEESKALGGYTEAPIQTTPAEHMAQAPPTKIANKFGSFDRVAADRKPYNPTGGYRPSESTDDSDAMDHIDVVGGDGEKAGTLVLSLNRSLFALQDGTGLPASAGAVSSECDRDHALFSTVQTDPQSTRLIIRSRPASRSNSPLPTTTDSIAIMGGHHHERKVKKKKKKNKSAKVVKDTREEGAPSLKLKITLPRAN